jgi:hypothetical protein
MEQPRDDVAPTVGYQDRSRRRQAPFPDVIGEPCQVESDGCDAGDAALLVLEALGEMDHPLAARLDPYFPVASPGWAMARSKKGWSDTDE